MPGMPEAQTFHHAMFDARALAEAKGTRVITVIIPARNEETTIGDIVVAIRTDLMDAVPLVDRSW